MKSKSSTIPAPHQLDVLPTRRILIGWRIRSCRSSCVNGRGCFPADDRDAFGRVMLSFPLQTLDHLPLRVVRCDRGRCKPLTLPASGHFRFLPPRLERGLPCRLRCPLITTDVISSALLCSLSVTQPPVGPFLMLPVGHSDEHEEILLHGQMTLQSPSDRASRSLSTAWSSATRSWAFASVLYSPTTQ